MPVRRVLVLALLTTFGCGENEPPARTVVRGQVTFRGAALPGGLIVFTPDADLGGRGPCAVGTIGSDGRYTLSTDGTSGAAPGKYRVTIAGPEAWRLPDRFLDPQSSGLHADVVAGPEFVVDFRLDDR